MAASLAGLSVHDHFNPEEAAHAAAEFVASLDNLPGEINFLLEEISEKDQRIQQLLTRINTRHYGLTKNSKNLSGSTPSSPSFPLPIPPGQAIPIDHLSTKDQQAMTKLQAEWVKVEHLQEEKIKLAERLERIVSRARERGRAEWKKVGGMDIDEVESAKNLPFVVGAGGEMGGGEIILPPSGLGSGTDGRPYKKRKPNALPLPLPSNPLPTPTIVHPPSTSMPPPSLPRPSLSARSAHSRHGRHISTSTLSDADGDGEVETGETGEGEADDTLYCFCQQKSYGEMIGCDNDKCAYEWFHVKCVNISGELPDTWYCPDCVIKLGLSSSDGSRAGGQKDKKGRRR